MTPEMQAATLIAEADGLLITAGAGMGVDSGLPDFRGTEGFWQAYPALQQAGIDFRSIATPSAFSGNARQAWGFYGHRLSLYRSTVPHDGFRLLKEIAGCLPRGAFVATSNVDGQFQKAGFQQSRVWELHGSIHRLQCLHACSDDIWSADSLVPTTDDAKCEWLGALPSCSKCQRLARPNVLMFNDWNWIDTFSSLRRDACERWMGDTVKLVVIELGAGTAIPSIRRIGKAVGAPLIRINPQEHHVPDSEGVGLKCGSLVGLQGIKSALETMEWAFENPAPPAVME